MSLHAELAGGVERLLLEALLAQPLRELSVLGHLALDDEVTARWVETHRQPIEGNVHDRRVDRVQTVGVVSHLIIGKQEEAFIVVLQADPVLERSHVVPEMQRPRGADAGQDSFSFFQHLSSVSRGRPCLRTFKGKCPGLSEMAALARAPRGPTSERMKDCWRSSGPR